MMLINNYLEFSTEVRSCLNSKLYEMILKTLPFSGIENEVAMWEMYGIYSTLPHKLRYLGKWNLEVGIQMKEPTKLTRRRDLEV